MIHAVDAGTVWFLFTNPSPPFALGIPQVQGLGLIHLQAYSSHPAEAFVEQNKLYGSQVLPCGGFGFPKLPQQSLVSYILLFSTVWPHPTELDFFSLNLERLVTVLLMEQGMEDALHLPRLGGRGSCHHSFVCQSACWHPRVPKSTALKRLHADIRYMSREAAGSHQIASSI